MSALSLRRYDYGPEAPSGRSVYVYPESINFGTEGAHDDTEIVVRFLIPTNDAQAGQQFLNTLISTNKTGSAVDALRADKTLGGVVDSLLVKAMRKNGVLQMPDSSRFYSCELVLDIIPSS